MTNPTAAEDMIEVDCDHATIVCRQVLAHAGAPDDIGDRVARSLIGNESAGAPSHGLLRLADYLQEAESGLLDVRARPTVTAVSDQVRIVDGQRGFGVLASDAIVANLCDMLNSHPLCAVSLVNAGHIGRLAEVGEPVARRGGVVLGFVNYLGGGQRVVPWQGRDGRLCTNPLLVAVPARPTPYVLDMSTSTVSEGKIRQRWLGGVDVPTGWLVDADGASVHDPAALYADPPTAFMTPVGGALGYKGFGLAVAVELLAGVISDAGFVQAGVTRRGNGGMFLGLSPTLNGRTYDEVLDDVEALRAHVTASGPSVRWPGQAQAQDSTRCIRISRWLWEQIVNCHRRTTC